MIGLIFPRRVLNIIMFICTFLGPWELDSVFQFLFHWFPILSKHSSTAILRHSSRHPPQLRWIFEVHQDRACVRWRCALVFCLVCHFHVAVRLDIRAHGRPAARICVDLVPAEASEPQCPAPGAASRRRGLWGAQAPTNLGREPAGGPKNRPEGDIKVTDKS